MWVLMLFSFVFSSTCNYKCQSSIVLLIFCFCVFCFICPFAYNYLPLHSFAIVCILMVFCLIFFLFYICSFILYLHSITFFFANVGVNFIFVIGFFRLLSVYFHLFICKVLHSITFFCNYKLVH